MNSGQLLSHFNSISQNFAYADVDGNIGLNTGGGIPVRKGMVQSSETAIQMNLTGKVMFHLISCRQVSILKITYVSSANNKTVSDDYPYYISFRFYVPYRINRIREMLDEKENPRA